MRLLLALVDCPKRFEHPLLSETLRDIPSDAKWVCTALDMRARIEIVEQFLSDPIPDPNDRYDGLRQTSAFLSPSPKLLPLLQLN
jgi:hypothetical protein